MTFCEGAILRETLMAVILCNYTYDSQGRRFEKKVTVAGATTLHHRYIYRGDLQIAALDLTRSAHPALWFVTWDPTESVATRPLVFRYAPNSLNLFYAFDGNKNVSDVFYKLTSNGIGAHYDYALFGAMTRTRVFGMITFCNNSVTIARRAYGKLVVHVREMSSECALTTHKTKCRGPGTSGAAALHLFGSFRHCRWKVFTVRRRGPA